MASKMKMVPQVSIRRDPRFSLEYNWEQIVIPNIQECQERGVLVTPLTVFDDGVIVGWYLHGWKAPPATILYEEPPARGDILDYCI